MKKYDKAIIDTTYILPLFGIKVHGIEYDTVINASRELNVKLLYPQLAIPELIAKIGKEMYRKNMKEIPEEVKEAITALLLGVDIELVPPKPNYLETAIKLRALGHRDIFDNILYATSLHEKTYFITRDREFIKFLKENKLPVNHIVEY